EDGIRVFHVTGVQTCALPISAGSVLMSPHDGGIHTDLPLDAPGRIREGLQRGDQLLPGSGTLPAAEQPVHRLPGAVTGRHVPPQIGRASCRARARVTAVADVR